MGPKFTVQVGSGGLETTAVVNTARLEAARRSGDLAEFEDAMEANLALARLLRNQMSLTAMLTACAIEAKTFERAQVVLAGGPDRAWLDAISGAIQRQRTELAPGLVFESERIQTQSFAAETFIYAFGSDSSGWKAVKELWGGRSWGYRLGSYAENRETIDRHFQTFEAMVAEPPHSRTVVINPPTDLGVLKSYSPERCRPVIEALDKNALDRSGIDTLIALERHRLKHGGYPQGLAELVPEFLAQLPLDPWSGKPLGYKRTDPAGDAAGRSFILYCVGGDRSDDGGLFNPTLDQAALLGLEYVSAPGIDYIINIEGAEKARAPTAPAGEK
jgi:hypothetical protein